MEVPPPQTQLPQPPPPGGGFTTLPTSGGSPDTNTTVTGVSAETTGDGGGIRLVVRFDGAVPVWAVHSSSRGQMLWLELSAPAAETQHANNLGRYSYGLYSSTTASWLTVNGRGTQEYRAAMRDSSLVLDVRTAAPVSGGGMIGLQGATDLVERFLADQVKGSNLDQYLSPTAQAQYAKLPPFRPTEYSIVRHSGQVPDTLLYEVRLSSQEAFTDQFLFVTAAGGSPEISLILGHQPVTRPADSDGRAALAVAFSYLDAWAKRDANGMYAALATAAQQSLTAEQKVLLGGLSNPHPFRYEIHAIEKIGQGCYRLQVLRSEEYTGEGELGRGIGPLYVTQADGRYGVLLQGACGAVP